MPGQVPIRNGQFSNAPDFNGQGVTGITGSGVFRSFNYSSIGATARTLQTSDLWDTLQLTGNCVITIPGSGLGVNVGDEIIIVNTTGTTAFTTSGGASLLGSEIITPSERPSRLIYIGTGSYGSNSWLLSGPKTNYSENSITDCCGSSFPSVYTLGDFSPSKVAYSNSFGTALYTSSAIGGVVVVGGNGYTINSGVITENPCATVDFGLYSYTVYTAGNSPYIIYSYLSVDLFNPSQVIGVPFKHTATSDVYPCDSVNPVVGTYYRTGDMYGVSDPMCFNANGVVTSLTACS